MRQKLSQILLYWSKEFANANLAVTWRINKILIDFSSSHDKPILVPQAATWKCFIKKLFWNTKLQKTPTANSFKNRWKPSSPTLLKKDSITRALVNLLKYFRDTTLWNTYEQPFLLFQQQLRYFTKKKWYESFQIKIPPTSISHFESLRSSYNSEVHLSCQHLIDAFPNIQQIVQDTYAMFWTICTI